MTSRESDWQCISCQKKYSSHASYAVHMKNKHNQVVRSVAIANYRNKFTEQQLSDLQDKIYVFLGELGDSSLEEMTQRQQNISSGEDQIPLMASMNFMPNSVVKTPFDEQFTLNKELLETNGNQQWKTTLNMIKEQMMLVYERLMKQKERWQYMDPLADEEDPDNEFSLMDISKLIKNLGKRQIKLQFPEFTVYILWLTRVCKLQSWKQIYESTIYCVCQFYDYLLANNLEKTVGTWIAYVATRNQELIQQYKYKNTGFIISPTNMNQILQLYYQWVQYFGVLPKRQINIP